jgi:hypothetical protein
MASSEMDSDLINPNTTSSLVSKSVLEGDTNTMVSQDEKETTVPRNSDHGDRLTNLPSITPQPIELREALSSACSDVSYEIRRCEIPPASEMEPVEKFVVNAMRSQRISSWGGGDMGTTTEPPDPSHVEGYKVIIASLKQPSDPITLRKLLLALRTAGHGSVLNDLALGKDHEKLVHFIIRFNPTAPPNKYEELFTGNLEEMLKVYEDYSLCDAHFNLLLSMVSAKSTHVLPILSSIWKFLTKYGPIQDEMM